MDEYYARFVLCNIGLFVASLLFHASEAYIISTGDFNKDFFISWAPTHINTSADGKARSLMLDQQSGSGFASNQMFLFGKIDMQIKLITGNSAGTVVAFYLASDQSNRDEIDLEFLGNVIGKPYILQTNIYADGSGNREERINLWFDPTEAFHTYSVLWNLYQIVFMVDEVPIRVYRNHADKGVAYPQWQPMGIKMSLWDGDDWATRGGKDKIDWSKAPFVVTFKDYRIDACVWEANPRVCRAESGGNWWHKDRFRSLTWGQRRMFRWVRLHHLIYDYCQDAPRFQNKLPKECLLSKFA